MNKTRNAWITSLVLLSGLYSPMTFAQKAPVCPDEPNRVLPVVSVDVRHDAATGLYSYSYVVRNKSASKQAIESFSVETIEPVSELHAPKGWVVSIGSAGRPVVVWDAAEVADPELVPDDASIPQSVVQIKPGSSLAGFSFKSPKAPGRVRYFAMGYVPLPSVVGRDKGDAELAAEELQESCASLQLSPLDMTFVASTRGPVDATANLVLGIQGPDVVQHTTKNAYRLTVTNEGSSEAKRPRLAIAGNAFSDSTKVMPAEMGWRCRTWPRRGAAPVTIVCDSDTDLAPGNAQAFDIEFSPRAAFRQGFVSVQGPVPSSTPDTNLADNRAGSTVPIR